VADKDASKIGRSDSPTKMKVEIGNAKRITEIIQMMADSIRKLIPAE
jgi:hypothetical protein